MSYGRGAAAPFSPRFEHPEVVAQLAGQLQEVETQAYKW